MIRKAQNPIVNTERDGGKDCYSDVLNQNHYWVDIRYARDAVAAADRLFGGECEVMMPDRYRDEAVIRRTLDFGFISVTVSYLTIEGHALMYFDDINKPIYSGNLPSTVTSYSELRRFVKSILIKAAVEMLSEEGSDD